MWNFKEQFNVRQWVVFGAFFAAFLAIGLALYQDYGVHWDENANQIFGNRWGHYISEVAKTRSLVAPFPRSLPLHDKIHGPAFEIFLDALARHYRLEDPRDVILMRHRVVFLFFYGGVIFFYFFCRKIFKSWGWALLASVFLVLSPRIFADAFYNSVDSAFLSFFMIGMFTLVGMLDHRTFLSTAAHALICAILINIRLAGIFLPLVTVFFFCRGMMCSGPPKDKARDRKTLAGYFLFLGALFVLLNPFLWANPLINFAKLVWNTIKFNEWDRRNLFYGRYFAYEKAPWYYGPLWIAITTPVSYLFFFFVGAGVSLTLFLRREPDPSLTKRNIAIVLACFFLPLILTTGKIYNGWRHLYFIYPSFVILAVLGVRSVWQNVRPVIRGVLAIALVLGFLDTVAFMVRNHPYQNIYFNRFAGKDTHEISGRFDLDYWGLSYREALEYILKTDKAAHILVASPLPREQFNWNILLSGGGARLVDAPREKAKYFLTNNMTQLLKYEKEYYSIKVDGMKILVVYKLDHERGP